MNLQGRDLKPDLTGDDVRLLHAELARIGLAVPDAERRNALFGAGTRDAVLRFQKDHRLRTTGVVDAETARAINQAVDAGRPTEPPGDEAASYTVDGTVASPDRAGVGGLRIQIVDKNVGRDIPLAEAITDERGHYQVAFMSRALPAGKSRPDLQARVFSGQTFVAASEVRYDATTRETLNVMVPANAGTLPSEHETLTAAIAARFTGRLSALQESDDRQDITYLANKTGWDARAVALAALADRFAQPSAGTADAAPTPTIKPAFYYALFRAGLPANDALYQVDTKTVERVWKQAIDQGVIPATLAPEIGAAAEAFQRTGAQTTLTRPPIAGTSTLKEMLAVSNLDDARQQMFAQLYANMRTDLPAFWKAVADAFGVDTAKRLQVDGQLGFLTINNAPLAQAVRRAAGNGSDLSDPRQLADAGYHRATKWSALLTANVPIPKEIPGDTVDARRGNYAAYLAAQVRLSYPTAAMAEMIRSGDLPLPGAAPPVVNQVQKFLADNQGKFEIGVQPVQQYIARNHLQVPPETVAHVKRLQRVYQITPSDQAMGALLKRGVDAAAHVVRYDRNAFVSTFAPEVGGEAPALQIYDKAVQVNHAVLNLAISYLTAKGGIQLGAPSLAAAPQNGGSGGQILQPAPAGPAAANAGDVIAYPTLEGLFGSMDFCACEHCRSILSPAAYLVDLLLFIDQAPLQQGKENPQAVLFDRRPDVQHLPLTCENTNTALPYIDVVNETLEYFIANTVQQLSLTGYVGHDTNGTASEDLMASPQFVMDSAYAALQDQRFPMPLPFHRPLENLRRLFSKFDVPLTLAMERFRPGDALERGANPFGWRDILMEEVKLSRSEHEVLTDSAAVPLWRMYGFADGTPDTTVIAELSNAKRFARRLGISYEDLVAILGTRFVNPNSDLVPKLERLGVSFAALQTLKETDTPAANAAFDALLPTGAGAPDPDEFGGDIKAWVKQPANFDRIMRIITLTDADPAGGADSCTFDTLEFRYSKPMVSPADTSTRLAGVGFVRLLRFIRLWKKTGWTIDQTDAAICALLPVPPFPLAEAAIDTIAKLDAGFLLLLPRLGIVLRVMSALNLTAKRHLLPLLTTWSPIGTHGEGALYRQMFLNPALLKQDAAFADNGFGEFLQDNSQRVLLHAEALRSAFNLTGDEFERIVAALEFDANTVLNLENISAIYRRGWLARTLKLSVRELLLLIELTGLDPFAKPNPTAPAIMRIGSLLQALKERSLKLSSALYLIWNQDLSGKSAPDPRQITEFARTLRGDFAGIEEQFATTEDPSGDVARARMALVYGQEAADTFFSFLDDTVIEDVPYTHPTPSLEPGITAADAKIAYNDFRHLLSYTGVLTVPHRNALESVPGVPPAFQEAVGTLFEEIEDAKGSFFARYPELKPLYDSYVASADPVPVKRNALLAAFKPTLSRHRKRQQALQRLSAAVSLDMLFAQRLLDPPTGAYPLHAEGHTDAPALDDVLALETPGLGVQFFFRDTATGIVNLDFPAADNLDYGPTAGNPLPANPTPGDPISGVWRGQVETPEAGFFNVVIEADSSATVTLSLRGQVRPLTRNGNAWRNTDPLELAAATLYDFVVTVEKVKDRVRIQWETPKRPREVIPGRYLYPPTIIAPFSDAYVRFLKAASLATALRLSADEMAHFAIDAEYRINATGQLDPNGDGWLNVLPDADNRHLANPAEAAVARALNASLLTPLGALLDFARIKAAISADDESLLAVLDNPTAATQTAEGVLFTITRWDALSLNAVLAQIGGNIAGLSSLTLFRRVYDAFTLIQTMGISGSAMIAATTNEPTADTVRDLQAALRARYAAADWRDVVQPINDEMRGRQRDALVAFILHQMRANPATAHIDTADKLFEYFLMDVQMEPRMQTSRIRHALSSVQLFIERCLMNLEPRVAPASINGKQWEWMKRYRVWEANRKVFLFPENWLEPELRDDKSPFFKEIESELLQSDITDESATAAMLTYLSKLEEVAKLEPVGLFYIAADTAKRTGEITHVIARTAGAHRKYYYRRYEYGYWTPWEAVKLDIEDNPVIPIVWKDRLLLFWLRVMKQGPATSQKPTSNTKLTDLTIGGLPGDPAVSGKAVLCWSEYYNGKWQTAKTSDVDRPAALTSIVRSGMTMRASEEGNELRVVVSGGGASFLLYNSHSLPVRGEDAPAVATIAAGEERWFAGDFTSDFAFEYLNLTTGADMERDILKPTLPYEMVRQRQWLDAWNSPFFYADSRHAFFVKTTSERVLIFNYQDFGVAVSPVLQQPAKIPPLVLQADPSMRVKPKFPGDPGPLGPDPGVVDPLPMRQFVTEDAYIRQGIGNIGTVRYGDRQIGPSGAIVNVSSKI